MKKKKKKKIEIFSKFEKIKKNAMCGKKCE